MPCICTVHVPYDRDVLFGLYSCQYSMLLLCATWSNAPDFHEAFFGDESWTLARLRAVNVNVSTLSQAVHAATRYKTVHQVGQAAQTPASHHSCSASSLLSLLALFGMFV